MKIYIFIQIVIYIIAYIFIYICIYLIIYLCIFIHAYVHHSLIELYWELYIAIYNYSDVKHFVLHYQILVGFRLLLIWINAACYGSRPAPRCWKNTFIRWIKWSFVVVCIIHSFRLWSSACRVHWGTLSCMSVKINPWFRQSVATLAHEVICTLWFCGSNFFVLMTSFHPGPLVLGSIVHGRLSSF